MANITAVNVYKVNQKDPIPLADVTSIGFPSTFAGLKLRDCLNSPTRGLSTGVNVYSAIQDEAGNQYYCRETVAQIITLFG